ncbi:MAG: LysE/ArgO family amino acid transporter [archaeon]|nr:LysE/ArgO family amino acid transporter [archaeon]
MYAFYLEGFLLSLGLIVAIGAQNAFVLRQGLMSSHIFLVCLLCSISDATLIFIGVYGVGSWLSSINAARVAITLMAALFLLFYGFLRIRSATHPVGLELEHAKATSRKTTAFTALAFTWLNPHVYMDTLLLIGGASARYVGSERSAFAIGAATASFVFFFSLGYGARLLSSKLSQPTIWRFIDSIIALLMFILSGVLIRSLV